MEPDLLGKVQELVRAEARDAVRAEWEWAVPMQHRAAIVYVRNVEPLLCIKEDSRAP